MITRIAWLLSAGFILFLGWVIYQANTHPGHPMFVWLQWHVPYADKMGHIVLYGTLAFILTLALRFRRWGTLPLYAGAWLAFAFGLAEELTQAWFPARTQDWRDLLANTIGIGLATLALWGLETRFRGAPERARRRMAAQQARADADGVFIRAFRSEDMLQVVQLWQTCALVVPWNDPHKDIERKQSVQPELFLLACKQDEIIGSVMAGYDGHRGWINYLAVHPEHQRRGVGRRLMTAAEERLRALGCPKINLQVRASNIDVIAFYQRLGFRDDEVLSLGKRLEVDG